MKVFKWLILALILFIIGVNFYLTIIGNRPFDKIGFLVLLLIMIVIVLQRRGGVYWWLGFLICFYGLYNLMFISVKAAEATSMEFTASLNYLIFKNKMGFLVRHVIRLIPLFFYCSFLLFLLCKPGRRYYFDKSITS